MAKQPTSDWQRMKDVLEEALDLHPDERKSFVERRCADADLRRQVLSMIYAFESGVETSSEDELETETLDRAESTDEDLYGPGSEIGAYRLEKSIGAGGMGSVFLASRRDAGFEQQVAIKLLKRRWASSDEVSRFRRERQILADLKHPAIAQLLDGGNTELGHPYLVMELVEGRPINTYYRQARISLEQRIALFLQVCEAVQYAHRNLIVHRDLKPSNILVDEQGRVKLLDFGIAKILDTTDFAVTVHETRPGSSPMTLAYASPEQIQGRVVTVTTDVYSLGILLYELLSDRRPYEFDSRDLLAAVSAICHQEVTHPSHEIRKAAGRPGEDEVGLVGWRQVQGDLDAIVLKALAKNPEDRYASVEQLAEDLVRFQNHEPVRARVDTLVYRARKFVYRHRWGLSAAALIFSILVASIFVLLRQQEELIAQRNLAQQQQLRAQTVSDWMTELFELPDPGRSLGEQVTARELLDKSARSVREDLADDPEVLSQMLSVLSKTYANLGLYQEAEEAAESALQSAESHSEPEVIVEQMLKLSSVQREMGKYWQSQVLLVEAASRAESLDDLDPGLKVRLLIDRGITEYRLGRAGEAEPFFQEAEASARALEDKESLRKVLHFYGQMLSFQGKFEHADRLLREAVDLNLELYDRLHPDVARTEMAWIANTAAYLGAEAAEAELRQVIDRQRMVLGSEHPALATSLDQLSQLLIEMGRHEEGERVSREAIEMGVSTLGESHPLIARFLSNYGMQLMLGGRLEEAEDVLGRTLDMIEVELGKESFSYGNALNQLGSIAYRRGQYEKAEDLYHRAFRVLDQAAGPSHLRTIMALSNVATAKTRRGDREGARELYGHAVERARSAPEPPPHYSVLLFNAGMNDKALEENDSAVERLKEAIRLEGDSRSGLEIRAHLSHLLSSLERWQEAEGYAREALDGFRRMEGAGAWEESAVRALAKTDLGLGRLEESIERNEWLLERITERPSTSEEYLQSIRDDIDEAEEALNRPRD